MTKSVLTENDGKHPRRRFSNRFSETVMTNAILSQMDAKRNLEQETQF